LHRADDAINRCVMHAASFAVLRLLADGRVRTCAGVAATLSLSRRRVEWALRELAEHRVEVTTTRGQGVRLARPFDALDADVIERELATLSASAPSLPKPFARSRMEQDGTPYFDVGEAAGGKTSCETFSAGLPVRIRLEVIDECASTNSWLAAQAETGAPTGAAVVCELQHAGRGRRGASWVSGLGTSLTFSLLWRFDRGAAALGGLSLTAGVACARALDALGVSRVALKWPNDLLLDGAKLGGILVEASGEPHGPTAAVVGIGINIRFEPAAKRTIGQPTADLAASGVTVSRNLVLARLLVELTSAFSRFAHGGFTPFRAEWLRRHAYQGAPVRVLAPPRAIDGIAADIAEDGALILQTAGGRERFHAAEVSLRRAA
jgi:BirA family biotin operon repressor/biotin-[acetyl-CoA-carboxylase] ligase